MPLVVVSGQPCSGKSSVVAELAAELRRGGLDAVVVSEDSLGLVRGESYRDGHAEKVTRSLLKSAADMALGGEAVVLLDSINGIKGYRYELWCLAREVSTRCCVLHVDTSPEQCERWNAERPAADRYPEAVLHDLLGRFEVPDSRNRWEAPLVTVRPVLGTAHVREAAVAAAALVDPARATSPAAAGARELKATLATSERRATDATLLHRIDLVTQAVATRIVEEQVASADGNASAVLLGGGVALRLPRPVSLAELRRLRRNFLQLITNQAISTRLPDERAIQRLFAEYVQAQLDT